MFRDLNAVLKTVRSVYYRTYHSIVSLKDSRLELRETHKVLGFGS